MVRFSRSESSGITVWRGDPDCQAAHDEILQHLAQRNAPFLSPSETMGTRRIGNLGEHIAFRIGAAYDYSNHVRKISNAVNPLEDISSSGIDITWLLLSEQAPGNDIVIIQETKTTGQAALGYANELVSDYKKLFSTNLRHTLATRLQDLATYLEYGNNASYDTLQRVIALSGSSPRTSTKVRLVPTLLHDRSNDSVPKLLSIRMLIGSLGWDLSQITPWSIALSDLIKRLERIARGTR